jgi:hypothetical protein
MDNHIITILQNFKKPEASFLQDKECLICLENFGLESLKIVKLPCGCSNSVYHIVCIVKLLHSGQNKNFCPHCKTIYEIPLQQIQPVERHQVLPYIVINTQQHDIHNSQIKHFTHILVFHIFSNSIMNFINIGLSRLCVDYNRLEILKILMILYSSKLFFNYFILIYSKNNLDKIADFLVCSYVFQTVLFGLLIYSSTKIKNDYNSIILIFNNVFFNCGDLTFRVIIEYKMRNTVNILE